MFRHRQMCPDLQFALCLRSLYFNFHRAHFSCSAYHSTGSNFPMTRESGAISRCVTLSRTQSPNWSQPSHFHFHRNRPLKQTLPKVRHDDSPSELTRMPSSPPRFRNSLAPVDPLPDTARVASHPRRDGHLQRSNFLVGYRNRCASASHNLQNARSDDQRSPIAKIKPTEQVSREEGLFQFLHPVGPLPDALVRR